MIRKYRTGWCQAKGKSTLQRKNRHSSSNRPEKEISIKKIISEGLPKYLCSTKTSSQTTRNSMIFQWSFTTPLPKKTHQWCFLKEDNRLLITFTTSPSSEIVSSRKRTTWKTTQDWWDKANRTTGIQINQGKLKSPSCLPVSTRGQVQPRAKRKKEK